MKHIKYCLVISLLVFSHITTAASWYQVEVVVFDRLNPDLDGEQWQNEDFTIRNNLVELQSADAALNTVEELVPYIILDNSRNRLNGVQRALKLSSQYRPLIHLSWQQAATQRRQSRYVHLQRFDGNQSMSVTDSVNLDAEPEFLEEIIPLNRIIDGSIRIRSGFYLHADVDLNYFKDLPAENKILRTSEESYIGATDKTIIKLKETRKIKLNEIHYFDHPMLGVILQVSRLK
jgi:Peptidoglycan-binding protein, CsiV